MGTVQEKYISEKETIIEALNDIDSFKDKMGIFIEKYPYYSYTVDIKPCSKERNKNKWIVELIVKVDESARQKAVEGRTRPS